MVVAIDSNLHHMDILMCTLRLKAIYILMIIIQTRILLWHLERYDFTFLYNLPLDHIYVVTSKWRDNLFH